MSTHRQFSPFGTQERSRRRTTLQEHIPSSVHDEQRLNDPVPTVSETASIHVASVTVGSAPAQNDLPPVLTPHAAQVLLRIIIKHKTRLDAA